jgi:long-subunit acyl-CoA synthetase (AMP-forming)
MEVARIFERKVGMKLRSGWGMTETVARLARRIRRMDRTSRVRSG